MFCDIKWPRLGQTFAAKGQRDDLMKWFMVLGAGEFQLPLIRAAKAKGMSVAVVSIAGDYPGFAEADARVICDVRDKEAVLKAAREYEICGIATDQTDLPVPTVDRKSVV